MANKIQLRRGLKSALPMLSSGEPAYVTDTRELFVGTGNGNVNMGGSHWYRGTAMSGTSTAANAYSYSACPQVKLDDVYLNTSNGNVYACTTAGSGSSAKWTYQGCIRGAQGATGATPPTPWTQISSEEWEATDDIAVNNIYVNGLISFNSNGYLNMDEVTEAVDAKHRAATIVIGTENSSAQTKDAYGGNLDYICTGTNDHVKINEAITALPASGGKIVLREGSYNISSVINCTKNIVFEGMGDATVLNFNGNSNILQGDIQISFVGLKINFVVSGPIDNDDEGRSLVYGNKSSASTNRKVNMVDCTLTFTNNNILRCASAFKYCGHVKIVNSSVELKNNATPTSYTKYTPRIYLIFDGHDDGGLNSVMNYAEISNCNIECTGKVSGSYKALASISRCGRAVVSNSYIKLGICGSITDGIGVEADTDISSITNCNIYHSGTTDVYIAGYIFNGNVYTTTGGILYFSENIIIMGNRFKNHATNDIKIGLSGSGTATIIGNRTSYTCEFTNSTATSTKKDCNT